jgi:alginate biosynthesis protein AlgX
MKMRRRGFLIHPALPPALLWLLLFLPGTGGAQERALEYKVTPCCSPCAAVNNRANYNTGFLSIFPILMRGKDDWLFRSEVELMTAFGPTAEGLRQLKVFSDLLKARGTQLVVIYHPTRGLVHLSKLPDSVDFDYAAASANYRQALERFRSIGVIAPDLTPLLNEPPQKHEYFFRRDHHWTPYGAERVARLVADELRNHPQYQSLERRSFANRRAGLMKKTGTLQRAWQRLCADTFADQYVDEFVSEAVEQVAGGNQQELLFGNKLPSTTLVGTSYSGGEVNYNFEGYLKEYLGIDILNEAMAGGGAYDAMIRYLLSEGFRTQAPKFLLWEVPAYHDLSKEMFYRQVYALIGNGCAGKPVALAKTTRLRPGRNEILFNGGGELKDIRGGNYVLDMKFDNPLARDINATIWYVNGRHERVAIRHGVSVDSRGHFMVALRNDAEWKAFNFLSVDLNVEPPLPAASITATLCKDIPAAAPVVSR